MATDIRLKESSLPSITDRIVATYVECRGIHHLDHCPLPSREVIIRLIDDLYELMYPGFGRRQNLHLSNVEYHAGALLVNLHDTLTEQISRALKHDCESRGNNRSDYEHDGQKKAVLFLEALPRSGVCWPMIPRPPSMETPLPSTLPKSFSAIPASTPSPFTGLLTIYTCSVFR